MFNKELKFRYTVYRNLYVVVWINDGLDFIFARIVRNDRKDRSELPRRWETLTPLDRSNSGIWCLDLLVLRFSRCVRRGRAMSSFPSQWV